MITTEVLEVAENDSIFDILKIKTDVYKKELLTGIEQGIYLGDSESIEKMSYDELKNEYDEMVRNIREGKLYYRLD